MHKMPALLISTFHLGICFAQDVENKHFQYFAGRDIDYWNEGKTVKNNVLDLVNAKTSNVLDNSTNVYFSGANTIRSMDAVSFSWKNYQDPKRAEFWDDGGDWIPPRPFRETAANPTKENIAYYLNWMTHKTEVVDRFQKSLTDFVPVESHMIDFDWHKIKIVYVYQTSCSHCRNSAGVIEEARQRGAQITFVQLDSSKNTPLHSNSISYEEVLGLMTNEMTDLIRSVTSTPSWFLKSGTHSQKLVGELSFTELSNAAGQLFKKGKSYE